MSGHQAVLLAEAVEGLAIDPEGIYIDCTFGRGGHSGEILAGLSAKGRLIAIDKDLEAIAHAKERFGEDKRFEIYHGSYARLQEFAKKAEVLGQVAGVLLDLGVSSPQLDSPERGFSFIHEGPLDMRMDKTQSLSAETFVNSAKEDEMVQVFRTYGEERFAGRIARAIIASRAQGRITNTKVLAEIVKQANPKWERHKHPATRVFQAIRIHVNNELKELESCLEQSLNVLKPGGRLAVISFHSLEDRIVKQFMRNREQGEVLPPGIPVTAKQMETDFKRVGKAIKPTEAETLHNVRARSAVLRLGEKVK